MCRSNYRGGFIKTFYFSLSLIIMLPSCHWTAHEKETLKFNPALNKVYCFSVEKNSLKSWTYQSIPVKIYDTVYINFLMQNINNSDSSVTCRLVWNRFVWKGKFKVNYIRDSVNALSTNVVMSDRGKVKYIQDMSKVLMDIEKDSNTGKYLRGVIPDQMGTEAITDMLNRIFSVIPERDVKNNTWITDITLTTNHQVNISNFNALEGINGDTAEVKIQSNVFARLSSGSDVYLQGHQNGIAYISYATGIPYWYNTESEIITTTNFYDIKQSEKIILRLQ
jgi:hypothetical protein